MITRDDILEIEEAFTDLLAGDGQLGILIDICELDDLTEAAIKEDVRFEFGMLGELPRMACIAIVSDKQWVGALTRFFDPVLAAVDIRRFATSDRSEARRFASQVPASAPEIEGPGIRILETDQTDLMMFEIDGYITKVATARIVSEMDAWMEGKENLRLIAKFVNFRGFDPAILTQRSLFSFKFAAAEKVSRYAVVDAPSWMKTLASPAAFLFSNLEMKFFDDLENARKWVMES